MSLRDELLAIREEYGKLTAQAVITAASEPDHPLHDRFEWDDTAAAAKYRLDQARRLIRVVRIEYQEQGGNLSSVREFHAVRDHSGTMAYQPAQEIILDDIARTVLLRQMERDWQILRRRYSQFSEFADLVLRDVRGDTGS